MSFFEYLKEHGNDNGYKPSGPPTDEPMTTRPRDSDELVKRLEALSARLERGEELFHPDERPEVIPSSESAKPFLEDTPRGYKARGLLRMVECQIRGKPKCETARPRTVRRKQRKQPKG